MHSKRLWTSTTFVIRLVMLAHPCGGFLKSIDLSSLSWTPLMNSLITITFLGHDLGCNAKQPKIVTFNSCMLDIAHKTSFLRWSCHHKPQGDYLAHGQ
jgi:hypothetical protein